MRVVVTRTERFSSAHRLQSDQLSCEENAARYGKCNGKSGHGHNYVLEVGVSVEVPDNAQAVPGDDGMVADLGALSKAAWRCALADLDHGNIDTDVAHFGAGRVPSTAENIAIYVFQRLKPEIASPARLLFVRIRETDKNTAEVWASD